MSIKKIFEDFISEGWTKAQLMTRLNQIREYNTPEYMCLSDAEYNEIVAIINEKYPN